jgi:BlaI family penicillinase repressor
MTTAIRRLPDGELEVMQAVWACTPPLSKGDIQQRIYAVHPMAETTLLTILTRLTEKGFLSVTIEKRKKCYTPCVSQEAYLAAQSRSFFEKVCGGNVSAFAAALCSSGLSKDDLAQLRDLLEQDAL